MECLQFKLLIIIMVILVQLSQYLVLGILGYDNSEYLLYKEDISVFPRYLAKLYSVCMHYQYLQSMKVKTLTIDVPLTTSFCGTRSPCILSSPGGPKSMISSESPGDWRHLINSFLFQPVHEVPSSKELWTLLFIGCPFLAFYT